jgi:hypothetical protein
VARQHPHIHARHPRPRRRRAPRGGAGHQDGRQGAAAGRSFAPGRMQHAAFTAHKKP